MTKLIEIVSTRFGPRTGNFLVKSPYNGEFVKFAQNRNAKWCADTKEWAFDPRDEADVRGALMLHYATDGRDVGQTCTIKFSLGGLDGDSITFLGRPCVKRRGRDYRVELGDGVTVLEGGFGPSGGSVKNPRVDSIDGTILQLRDVSLARVRQALPEGDHFDGKACDWWITSVDALSAPEVPVVLEMSMTLEDICAAIA